MPVYRITVLEYAYARVNLRRTASLPLVCARGWPVINPSEQAQDRATPETFKENSNANE